MNPLILQEVIQKQSKNFITELEARESDFNSLIITFFTSPFKKCLVVETCDSMLRAGQILKVLRGINDNQNNCEVPEQYLRKENQTFMSWKQLLTISKETKNLPPLTNVFLCEFSKIGKIKKEGRKLLTKIIKSIQMSDLQKIIFVTSQKFLLDEYVKCIEREAFFKIDDTCRSLKYFEKLTKRTKTEAFINAAQYGHIRNLEKLLKNGVNINETYGLSKTTVLHIAAQEGHKDVVLILLKNGAHFMMDKDTNNPLHLAAWNGHKNIILVFLDNNVDVDAMGLGGTALQFAAFNGHHDIVEALLKYGANVNAINQNGMTALHLACCKRNFRVVLTLLNYGAEINICNNHGNTPLHLAVKCKNWDIVNELVERGADVNVRNNHSETPLDIAKRYKYVSQNQY